jgi:dihydropyrimidinase
MAEFDLVVCGGTVVTASDIFRADVGIVGGRIAALGERLDGAQVLDAGGLTISGPPPVASPASYPYELIFT